MTKLKPLALGAVIAALGFAGLVCAQQLALTGFTGAETWTMSVGGPQGPSTFVTVSQVRNSTGYQTLGATSGTIAVPATTDNVLIIAQPTGTTTINTPVTTAASPLTDGELFAVCNVTNAALTGQTVTLAAATGSTLATGVVTALGTLAARTCVELQYVQSSTTWYQVR